jgi:hypothetical protein
MIEQTAGLQGSATFDKFNPSLRHLYSVEFLVSVDVAFDYAFTSSWYPGTQLC